MKLFNILTIAMIIIVFITFEIYIIMAKIVPLFNRYSSFCRKQHKEIVKNVRRLLDGIEALKTPERFVLKLNEYHTLEAMETAVDNLEKLINEVE